MGFFSNLVNSIPVVGHIKGVVHYACGDKEAGDKAMYQSTRTSAVLGAGAVGALAGPAGAAVAAVYAGAITDSVASVAMDKPQGIIKGCHDIAEDITEGRNPVGSIVNTEFQIGMDGLGGVGMGGVSSAVSQVSEKAVENVAKNVVKIAGEKTIQKTVKMTGEEVVKSVAETVTKEAVKKTIQSAAVQAEVILVSAHVCKQANEYTKQEEEERDREERRREEQRNREERERRNREQKEQRAREQKEQCAREQKEQGGTSGSSSGSSQPPQRDKDNNKKSGKEKPDYFAIFMKLLQKLLDLVFLNKETTTRANISQIFEGLSQGQIEYLVKIIQKLQKSEILEEVLTLVIKIFSEHFPEHISFPNFLSLMEFVAVYIQEEIHDLSEVFRMTEITLIERDRSIPRMKPRDLRATVLSTIMNSADIVSRIVDKFVKMRREIRTELANSNLYPNFRDIFSAVYHYFKHRCVPDDGVLSVREYFDWIRRVLKELGKQQRYTDLLEAQRTGNVRADVIFQMYVVFGRRIKIVVKFQGSGIVLASCYFLDNTYDGDKDGDVWIDVFRF